MEARYLVCKDDIAFGLLQATIEGGPGKYSVLSVPYDGKVFVRLMPFDAFAVKFVGILLSTSDGLTGLPGDSEVGLNQTQLAALPERMRRELPENPTERQLIALLRQEFPHDGSFRS